MSYPDHYYPKLYDALRRLADREIQEQEWFSEATWWAGPDEAVCEVFDGCGLMAYVNDHDPEIALTIEEKQAAHGLRKAVDDFRNSHPEPWYSREVLEDPNWQHVRAAANRLLLALAHRIKEQS